MLLPVSSTASAHRFPHSFKKDTLPSVPKREDSFDVILKMMNDHRSTPHADVKEDPIHLEIMKFIQDNVGYGSYPALKQDSDFDLTPHTVRHVESLVSPISDDSSVHQSRDSGLTQSNENQVSGSANPNDDNKWSPDSNPNMNYSLYPNYTTNPSSSSEYTHPFQYYSDSKMPSFVGNLYNQHSHHQLAHSTSYLPSNMPNMPPLAIDTSFSNFDNYNQFDAFSKRTRSSIDSHATASPTTAKEPKTPGSTSRRKTVIETCTCVGSCRRPVSMVYMRGTIRSLEKSYTIQVVCDNCTNPQDEHSLSKDSNEVYVPTTRKRSRDMSGSIECEVCRRTIGFGGIKPVETDNYERNENELSVEYVCLPCGSKYLFCSECGGGGKTRTGKWRPRDLFDQGRRTCSLPHIRIGSAQVKHEIIQPSINLDEQVMKEIQDVFFDCNLSLYAVPAFMESQKYGSFENIRDEISKIWMESVLNVVMAPTHHDLERFMVVEWIDKPHRNKGKGKSPTRDLAGRWLNRLGLDYISKLGLKPSTLPIEEISDRCYVAFAVVEWNKKNRTVFISQMVPRSIFLRPAEMYSDLLRLTVNHITDMCKSDGILNPLHYWCWTKNDNTRAKMIPERLGFMEKDEYLNFNRSCPPQLFTKPGMTCLEDEDVTIYAISRDDLFKLNPSKK